MKKLIMPALIATMAISGTTASAGGESIVLAAMSPTITAVSAGATTALRIGSLSHALFNYTIPMTARTALALSYTIKIGGGVVAAAALTGVTVGIGAAVAEGINPGAITTSVEQLK